MLNNHKIKYQTIKALQSYHMANLAYIVTDKPNIGGLSYPRVEVSLCGGDLSFLTSDHSMLTVDAGLEINIYQKSHCLKDAEKEVLLIAAHVIRVVTKSQDKLGNLNPEGYDFRTESHDSDFVCLSLQFKFQHTEENHWS